MAARRCDIGCESWPDDPMFGTCIFCGEPTRRAQNIDPTVDFETARSLRLHDLFEDWYTRIYCVREGIPAEGPLA